MCEGWSLCEKNIKNFGFPRLIAASAIVKLVKYYELGIEKKVYL